MQDVTNLKVWKWRNNRMRVKMRCECIEFLQSSQKKVVTFRPSRNWYIYLLFFFYRTRIHHKWIILSSIVSLTFFFVCDDQIVRTLHTIMSKVIIVDIQPQFKVGHVNVNRFTRVMTNGPRSFPSRGWSVCDHRRVAFRFSLSPFCKHDQCARDR